ncbi:MAG: bile acid:sodium symporter family protein [Oscillibacter sp.]|nr:bile acid:sodium symporter family protein [Oscillibacter sp.]
MLNSILRADAWCARRMPLLLLAALALGVSFSEQLSFLCAFITPLMIYQTFANSLGGSFRDLGRVALHPLPILVVLLSLHVVMPLLALGVGSLFFPEQPLYTLGLVLEEASPAAVSSLMWVVMGAGNAELCLSVVLLDTVLSPLVFPLTLRLLAGSVLEVDVAGMFGNLLIMIVLPAVAAMSLRRFAGQERCDWLKLRLRPFAKLALLCISMATVTRCAPFLRGLTPELILLIFLTLVMRLGALGLGYLFARLFRFEPTTRLTATLCSGMRNTAAASTIAATYFPWQVMFSPSCAPLFSQLTASLALHVLTRGKKNERT